jgi:hypothetical protein
MAKYPGAAWHGPVPAVVPNGITEHRFVVIHIMEGTQAGTDAEFTAADATTSAHFGVDTDGTVWQWVDTDDKAEAQRAGNPVGISIEHAGYATGPLTNAQISADRRLLDWIHQTHDIPLVVTDDPDDGTGVIGHGQGAPAWGHAVCPGPSVLAQLGDLVARTPAVSDVYPAEGPVDGGTSVSIAGWGLGDATEVTVGGVQATSVSMSSDTRLDVETPAGSGTVSVAVTNSAGVTPDDRVGSFHYVEYGSAVVTGVDPDHGSGAGADSVLITGSGFTGVTEVVFGEAVSPGIDVASDSEIEATSPSGAGVVAVSVVAADGPSRPSDDARYRFVPGAAPAVTSIEPTSGPAGGGTLVTVTGSGLRDSTDVSFGDVPALGVAVRSDTWIEVVAPPGSGDVDVTVTNPVGTSVVGDATRFGYLDPPVVDMVAPDSGDAAGGTPVTVSGSNLDGASVVWFGDEPGTDVAVVSDGALTVTSPPGVGTQPVVVLGPGGTSDPGLQTQYSYL